MVKALVVLLVACASLLSPWPAATAAAQEGRSFRYERFDVEIEVLPDGTFYVLERQRLRFQGAYHGLSREVSLERVSSITEVSVSEGGRAYRQGYNQPGTFAVTSADRMLVVQWWFQDTRDPVRTYELRYRVSGGIRVYPAQDQLFWKAVPAGLRGPVDRAGGVVRLPTAVPAGQLVAAAYVGPRQEEVPPTAITSTEAHVAAADLRPGDELELRVGFPHGLVAAAPPEWQAAADRQEWWDRNAKPVLNLLMLVAALVVLGLGLGLVFMRWYARGRDPSPGKVARSLDRPPSDLPPGIVGTLVDEQAEWRDVLATLIDLGRRGVIRITELRDQKLAGSDLDYQLELLRDDLLGLPGYEKMVLGALFGAEKSVRLSEVRPRWQANARLFQERLYNEAAERGLFEGRPDEARRRAATVGFAAAAGGALGALLLGGALGASVPLVWLPFAALVVVGLAQALAARAMPRRTRLGALESARWRAFGRHLAERPVEERAFDLRDAYLPYAVALGVERSWLEQFASVGSPVPAYRGGGIGTTRGGGPVVIWGPPGGPWGMPGPYHPSGVDGPSRGLPPDEPSTGEGPPSDEGRGGGLAGGLKDANRSLLDLLNSAAEALSSGGPGGWTDGDGGGFGGGGFSGDAGGGGGSGGGGGGAF